MWSKQTKERVLCCEIFDIAKVWKEVPGRNFTNNFFWNILSTVTTEMDSSEDAPSINCDDSSNLLASIAESAVSHGDGDKEVNDTDLGDLDDDVYRSLLGITETDESIEVENEINEESINVEKGNKRVTVRKSKCHQLISTDLVKNGEDSMVKMNIPRTRFRQKCRIKHQKNSLRDALFNYVTEDGAYIDSNSSLLTIYNGNHTAIFSRFDSSISRLI